MLLEPLRDQIQTTISLPKMANTALVAPHHLRGKDNHISTRITKSLMVTTMTRTRIEIDQTPILHALHRLPKQRQLQTEMIHMEVSEACLSHRGDHIAAVIITTASAIHPLGGSTDLPSPWTWITAHQPRQNLILQRMHHPGQPTPNSVFLLSQRLSQRVRLQSQRFHKGSMLYLSGEMTSLVQDRLTMLQLNQRLTNKITPGLLSGLGWRLECAR